MQTGWLIELKQSVSARPLWYGITDENALGMTDDANKAIRFARKEDAEAVMTLDLGWTEAFACEHAWSDAPPRPRLRTNNPLPFSVVRPDGSKPD
jgi:hypothetical protein